MFPSSDSFRIANFLVGRSKSLSNLTIEEQFKNSLHCILNWTKNFFIYANELHFRRYIYIDYIYINNIIYYRLHLYLKKNWIKNVAFIREPVLCTIIESLKNWKKKFLFSRDRNLSSHSQPSWTSIGWYIHQFLIRRSV